MANDFFSILVNKKSRNIISLNIELRKTYNYSLNPQRSLEFRYRLESNFFALPNDSFANKQNLIMIK